MITELEKYRLKSGKPLVIDHGGITETIRKFQNGWVAVVLRKKESSVVQVTWFSSSSFDDYVKNNESEEEVAQFAKKHIRPNHAKTN